MNNSGQLNPPSKLSRCNCRDRQHETGKFLILEINDVICARLQWDFRHNKRRCLSTRHCHEMYEITACRALGNPY